MPPSFVVGRADHCALCLDGPLVSLEHARISWNGQAWILRDLGSTNGSFVTGTRLAPGDELRLEEGVEIAFGDPKDAWTVLDVEAPLPCVEHIESGHVLFIEGGLLPLPSAAEPAVSLLEGPPGTWLAEYADGVEELGDGSRIHSPDGEWLFHLPASVRATSRDLPAAGRVQQASLHFEDGLTTALVVDGRRVELAPRSHHGLLRTLAEQRLLDLRNEALPEAEHGWIHRQDLCATLGVTPQWLRLAVFRARHELAELGLRGANSIVERRTTSGQLRIGLVRVEVSASSTGPTTP
jgi:hypothetical protein